jgi:hypothetical protein
VQGSFTQCGPCLAYSQRLQRSGSQGTTCSPALTHPHLPHLQNGLAAGLASIDVLKGRSLLWTRVVLLLINVPLITLGARPNGLDLKVLEVRQEAGGRRQEAGAGRQGGWQAGTEGSALLGGPVNRLLRECSWVTLHLLRSCPVRQPLP